MRSVAHTSEVSYIYARLYVYIYKAAECLQLFTHRKVLMDSRLRQRMHSTDKVAGVTMGSPGTVHAPLQVCILN